MQTRQSQKRDLSPDYGLPPLKHVKDVSIVNRCLVAPTLKNVLNVVETTCGRQVT